MSNNKNDDNQQDSDINNELSNNSPKTEPDEPNEIMNSSTDTTFEPSTPKNESEQPSKKNTVKDSKIDVKKGNIQIGNNTYNGPKIDKIYQDYSNNYTFDNQDAQIFDFQHLQKIELAILRKETAADIAVFEEENLSKFENKLLDKRILFIHGEADTGKVFLAKKLANVLTEKAGVIRVFRSKRLHQNLNIDLSEFLQEQTNIRNSVIIFNNFLEHQNHSIQQLFLNLRRTTIKNSLLKHLEKQNTYLIFTSNNEFCEEILESISSTKISLELEQPSLTLLATAFDKLQHHIFKDTDLKEDQVLQINTWLIANKEYILESLGKIGVLASYFQRIIYQVKRRRNMLINDAFFQLELDRIANLSDWFATELKESEELWFWAISFTLCQSQPESTGVPVVLFEVIRRHILAYAKKNKLLQNKGLEAIMLRSEDVFIEKCQAEIYQHPTTQARFIKFRDSNYKGRVWGTLFKEYLPFLSRILTVIEQLTQHEKGTIRDYAAIILGRLSEGFPDQTKRILQQWASDNDRQVQVGHFYWGLWAVQNKKHRDRFLNFLAQLAQTSGRKENLDTKQRQQIHAAIRAYAKLATFMLPSTIKAFGKILENRLGQQILVVNSIGKSLDKIDAFQKINTIDDWIDNKAIKIVGQILINALFENKEEDAAIAIHIQFAIIYLCLTVDTATVFKELNKWMLKGNQSLQLLLLSLFLGKEGIIYRLSEFTIQIKRRNSSKIKASCHPIVYSLLSGKAAVRSISSFIKSIMDSFELLPLQVRRLYRQTLFFYLRKWVKNSLKLPFSLQNPMIDLYVELMLISKELEMELKWDMDYQFTEGRALAFKKAVQKRYFKI